MSDRDDVGSGGKELHQEIFNLDWIVGEMDENTVPVMRKRTIVDGEFIEHVIVGIKLILIGRIIRQSGPALASQATPSVPMNH